ncbi:arylsulfatase [Enterococcus faecium]|nr:arylsulfatase [Enterococcus faecium]
MLFGNCEGWRREIHGEHSLGLDSSQYILTEKWKFIWFPVKNTYQLFDMINDPNEMKNLYYDKKYESIIYEMKHKLVGYLKGREEGFVKNGQLIQIGISNIVSTLKSKK